MTELAFYAPTSVETALLPSLYRPSRTSRKTTYVNGGEALDVGAHARKEAIDELLCHRRKDAALEKELPDPSPPA